jgi:ribose transport system substrate-binding protein
MRRIGGRRTTLAALVAVAAVLALAAGNAPARVGGGSGSAGALAPGATAPISQAKAIIARWERPVANFTATAPPFDARAAAGGKTIGWVSVTTDIPFTQEMLKGARAGAKLLGMNISLCNGKGQVSEWVRCYQRFISQKVDIILSQSIDPRILKGAIGDANKAGIPVMTTSSNFSEAKRTWAGTVAENAQPFRLVSRLMGDFAVADSNGNVNALIITSNEVFVAPGQVQAIVGEFKKYCPQTCKAQVVNIPIADWQTRIPTVVQSTAQRNRDLNYVIPLYDGEVPFAIAGIRAAGAEDRVKVISFNASPGVMDFLKKKDVLAADVGVWIVHHGWASIDQAARVLAGQRNIPALRDPKLVTRMFTQANVDSLNFSKPDTWYGPLNITAFYRQQWQVG